jgi:hypothetical protein
MHVFVQPKEDCRAVHHPSPSAYTVKTPDNKSDKGHHACCYESDHHDTDTVCIAKTGGLEFRQLAMDGVLAVE